METVCQTELFNSKHKNKSPCGFFFSLVRLKLQHENHNLGPRTTEVVWGNLDLFPRGGSGGQLSLC